MDLSHIMRREWKEEKEKIKDKEVFMSDEFVRLMNQVSAHIGRSSLPVHLYSDRKQEAEIAFTDGTQIAINIGNTIIRSLPDKELKADSIEGYLGHECGHDRFTPMQFRTAYAKGILNGIVYPTLPQPADAVQEQSREELKEYLNDGNRAALQVVSQTLLYLQNVLEDVFVETAMCAMFPGTVSAGITLNAMRQLEMAQTIKQSQKNGLSTLAILLNSILQYARCGNINNYDGYEGDILDTLEQCMEIVDDAVILSNPVDRYRAANQLLLILWQAVREQIDKLDGLDEQEMEQAVEGFTKSLLESSAEYVEKESSKDGQEEENPFESENAEKEAVSQCGEALAGTDLTEIKNSSNEQIREVQEKNGGRFKARSIADRVKGYRKIQYDKAYSASSQAGRRHEIERILSNLAKQAVERKREEQIVKNLSEKAMGLVLPDIHRGCHYRIHRIPKVSEHLKDLYQLQMAALKPICNRLVQNMEEILQSDEESYENGLIMGRRMDVKSFSRPDKCYYSRQEIPDGETKLAVCVVVDESGSMSYGDRTTYARAASCIVHDFCVRAEVPIAIYGHTTGRDAEGEVVEIYSYAEYESVDGNDKYRIMDISSRNANRDGAALILAAERLLERPEEYKLLILISDGQPAAYGYSGQLAEEDLKEIKLQYKKQGIHFVAAAIGDDKEIIEGIYGDGYLDISSLPALPEKLVGEIMNYLE